MQKERLTSGERGFIIAAGGQEGWGAHKVYYVKFKTSMISMT
jgi:hypothetical protein